jgi:serine/threonine protein kinase
MAIDHPYDALPPGYRLGGYEILRVLGRGGFGLTYQARRSDVAGDMVAIKELYPSGIACRSRDMSVSALPGTDGAQIDDAVEMFLREAHIICNLKHPNIVSGVEAFRANSTGYLVMRYETGRNLRDSLRDPTGFRPSPKSLPVLLATLLDALDTLHRHELLHCDIKPDNIFLGVGFEPILIDLGSARRHTSGAGPEEASTYSQYFSAIEQVDNRFGSIGPWTDIYQLSAVLYRCISGGKLPDAIDRLDTAGDPYLPLAQLPESRPYPAALITGIDHGLCLLPKNRPQSVTQWRSAMGHVIPPVSRSRKGDARIQNPESRPRNAAQPPLTINNPQSPACPATPKPTQPTDPLLWVAGILLAIILLIVFVMAVNT